VSFAALRHRGYRGFFFSMAGAMMAGSIEHVISYWVIFEKFDSPALNGFAVVSHWLPFLLLSVWTGSLADRFNPRRLIQCGMVLFMLVSIAWGVLFLTDALQMWHAVVLLTFHGIAGVLWSPPSQVLLHDIVEPHLLPSAVRLNATSRYLGLLLGLAIGGLILLLMGPSLGILFNALLYIPTIWWLQRAPSRRAQGADVVVQRAVRGFADVAEALRAVKLNPTLLSMIALGGSASFFVGNAYQAQMPGFATDLGHGEADFSYSMLLAADAAGALFAGIVLESRGLLRPAPRTAFILAMIWCCALVCFSITHIYAVALLLLLIAGFVELSFNAMTQTLVQLNAPADMRGRVIGVFSMSNLGMRTFSGLTVGFLGSAIGIRWSLGLSAGILLLVFGILYARLIIGRRTVNTSVP
jgi:MFS family permease